MSDQQNEETNNIKAISRTMSHFRYVGSEVPFQDFPKPPFNGTITGWYKFHDLYVAKTTKAEAGHCYCPVHKEWIKVPRFQFYYIKRHLGTHSEYADQFGVERNHAIANLLASAPTVVFDQQQTQLMRRKIYSFLLTADRPFSDADNPFLKSLCPSISRADLRSVARKVADDIRQEMKVIFSSARCLRPSIDEWQDSSHRRYIGETIYMITNGEWKCFTVALSHIKSEHATADEIANILDCIDIKFELDSTQERYCSDNCNTMLAVQTAKGIQRFPCVIHHIHNLGKIIIINQKDFYSLLSEVASFLHSSSVYASFCATRV